jgi:hypothetical protein
MRDHPQGHHGWGVFYHTLHRLLQCEHATAVRLVSQCRRARPEMSNSHLATLLALTVRSITSRERHGARMFDGHISTPERMDLLHETLTVHESEISGVLLSRCNSFTGARRFLIPQLLIGHFAMRHRMRQVRLLDLGTGLGLLPRQLNHQGLYERFAPDLVWSSPDLGYVDIPLACRHGVDMPPLPDLNWVRDCHGPSAYYEARFRELLVSLEQVQAAGTVVRIEPMDILASRQLVAYLRQTRYNAVTCNFVLYQYGAETRLRVVDTVVRNLAAPGLFVSMEPAASLASAGCRVEVYPHGSTRPLHVADVSDGHFIGTVTPGPDYAAFLADHAWPAR